MSTNWYHCPECGAEHQLPVQSDDVLQRPNCSDCLMDRVKIVALVPGQAEESAQRCRYCRGDETAVACECV